MVSTQREPSTNVRTRVEPPWRIVGQQGPSSHGSLLMSRSARVRAVPGPCMSATTAIIIYGHWRDRPKWSTVWCVVRTPHATVGGRPSALKPNCPSACPAGVWAGMCWAGLGIAALSVIGRCLNCERNYRTPIDVQVCFWKSRRPVGVPSRFLCSSAQTGLTPCQDV